MIFPCKVYEVTVVILGTGKPFYQFNVITCPSNKFRFCVQQISTSAKVSKLSKLQKKISSKWDNLTYATMT